MDLYDLIEKTRFLGREFIVWLWWKSDRFEGKLELLGQGPYEVWLDDQITLEAEGEQVERSQLRGAAPATTPEAMEALRQGKVPTKARISISRDEREFTFVLVADSFSLSSVKPPSLLQDEVEERFYERMYLLEELDGLLLSLFKEFLLLRASAVWDSELAPGIRSWVKEEPTITRARYQELLAQAAAEIEGAGADRSAEIEPDPPLDDVS